MKGLETWVEKQRETARIVVRVGTRGSLQQVGVVAVEGGGYTASDDTWAATWTPAGELADTVRDMVEDAGYPDEYPRVRLDPYTAAGKRLNSKQWTHRGGPAGKPQADPVAGALQALSEGMLGMAQELRRANADLCRTLQMEREYAWQKTAEADEAKDLASEADAYATAMEMLADTEQQDDPLRRSAGELIAGIGPALQKAFAGGAGGGLPDAETVRKWAAVNPDWMEGLAKDQGLAEMFIDGFMSGQEGVSPDNEPAE